MFYMAKGYRMDITANNTIHSASIKFSPQEWIRIQLYSERTGFSVKDIVELIVKQGFTQLFSSVDDG